MTACWGGPRGSRYLLMEWGAGGPAAPAPTGGRASPLASAHCSAARQLCLGPGLLPSPHPAGTPTFQGPLEPAAPACPDLRGLSPTPAAWLGGGVLPAALGRVGEDRPATKPWCLGRHSVSVCCAVASSRRDPGGEAYLLCTHMCRVCQACPGAAPARSTRGSETRSHGLRDRKCQRPLLLPLASLRQDSPRPPSHAHSASLRGLAGTRPPWPPLECPGGGSPGLRTPSQFPHHRLP